MSATNSTDPLRQLIMGLVKDAMADQPAPVKAELSTDPADRPRRPRYHRRKPRRLPTFYRKSELEQLMATAEKQIEKSGRGTNTKGHRVCSVHVHHYALQDRMILVLGSYLGLRNAELRHLEVRHVNLVDRDIFVCGKGQVERIVPIPAKWLQLITDWCAWRRKGLLLRNKKGKIMHEGTINARLRRLGKLAKLAKRMHCHALRHTFCSRILEEGGDIVDIRDLAGHASLQSTAVYLHCAPEKRRSAIDRL